MSKAMILTLTWYLSLSSFLRSRRRSSRRPLMMREYPCEANISATALPIPEVAPVTKTIFWVLSSGLWDVVSVSLVCGGVLTMMSSVSSSFSELSVVWGGVWSCRVVEGEPDSGCVSAGTTSMILVVGVGSSRFCGCSRVAGVSIMGWSRASSAWVSSGWGSTGVGISAGMAKKSSFGSFL